MKNSYDLKLSRVNHFSIRLILLSLCIILQCIAALFTDYTADWDEAGNVCVSIPISQILHPHVTPPHLCLTRFFLSFLWAQYWEPLHYLLYGRGLQTWEWNSAHALRSPVHPLMLASVGKVFQVSMSCKVPHITLHALSLSDLTTIRSYIPNLNYNHPTPDLHHLTPHVLPPSASHHRISASTVITSTTLTQFI